MTNNRQIKTNTLPKTFEQQIECAKQHNIVFDKNNELNILKLINLNYVWIQHYAFRFEYFDHRHDKFSKPVKFNDIYSLFELDKKFSLLILNLILLLEKNLKSRFASEIATTFRVTSTQDQKFQNLFKINLIDYFKRNDYFNTKPIIWNFIEHISLGDLKNMIKNLNDKDKAINTFKSNFINNYCSIENLDILRKIRNLISHSQPFIKNFKGLEYFDNNLNKSLPLTFNIFINLLKNVCNKCLGNTSKIYLKEIDDFLCENKKDYTDKL